MSARLSPRRAGSWWILPSIFLPGFACADALSAGDPSAIFFSEYLEGIFEDNRALEIFNGTGSAVTLTGSFDVQIYLNGSPTASVQIGLIGIVPAGRTWVLTPSNVDPELLGHADQVEDSMIFNGNDAVVLRANGVVIDSVGTIGSDPGSGWGTPPQSTVNQTLRRFDALCTGDANPNDPYDPGNEWAGFLADAFSDLGEHFSLCSAALFSDDFETGNESRWSTTAPLTEEPWSAARMVRPVATGIPTDSSVSPSFSRSR